jgi:hypothetical protein
MAHPMLAMRPGRTSRAVRGRCGLLPGPRYPSRLRPLNAPLLVPNRALVLIRELLLILAQLVILAPLAILEPPGGLACLGLLRRLLQVRFGLARFLLGPSYRAVGSSRSSPQMPACAASSFG